MSAQRSIELSDASFDYLNNAPLPPASSLSPKSATTSLRKRPAPQVVKVAPFSSPKFSGVPRGLHHLNHAPFVPPPAHLESANYEPDESEVWRISVAQASGRSRHRWWSGGNRVNATRWLLTLVVGVVQAFVGVGANLASNAFSEWKYGAVNDLVASEKEGRAVRGSAFFTFLLYQTVFVCLAMLCVYIEPVCQGSGIPEIKCFLNGVIIPNVVRLKTLVCRVVGVVFSVSAGLPLGKEGPMVHCGAVVAASISQGRKKLFGVDTSFTVIDEFRNDKEKRDFVACGAASGICSAFGSPIGGVLFSLEEGASYWSAQLTWRCFFCSTTTLFTIYVLKGMEVGLGATSTDAMFTFGIFKSASDVGMTFSVWELFMFSLIGCLGGLIGAIFNGSNELLTIWRYKNVHVSQRRKFTEALVVSVAVTIVSYLMPIMWNSCTPLPVDMEEWDEQERLLVSKLVPFGCNPATHYNEVASLYLVPADTAIKQLFHFKEGGQSYATTFSTGALILFFVPYIALACVTYGIAVPSGLFVPSLLSGAAFGRLCGHLLHKIDNTNGTFADSGIYALMGAAAVLGGIARMTISLAIMLLEVTGNMQYLLPLMLTLSCSRFMGNMFNEGMYDVHINLKKIPFMQQEVPEVCETLDITAGMAMSRDVKCLRQVERAGVLHYMLSTCQHSTFPIVDESTGGTLYGTVSRNLICTILSKRAFGEPHLAAQEQSEAALSTMRQSPLVTYEEVYGLYPNFPSIKDVNLPPSDHDRFVDLRPYATTAPYSINETAGIERTYRLFRTMGLRLLCVCNHVNQVVGVITRKDLLPEALLASTGNTRRGHGPTIDWSEGGKTARPREDAFSNPRQRGGSMG